MSLYKGKDKILNSTVNVPITTTIGASSTDEQIPSAKAVYDNCIKDSIKTFTRIEQLGLSSGCSVEDIYNALPSNSYFEIGTNNVAVSGTNYAIVVTDVPNQNGGLLTIRKSNPARNSIEYRTTNGNGLMTDLYIAQFKGVDGTGLTWKRVCTTSVEDVPVTSIIIDTTKFTKKEDSSYISYCVVNGMCTIQVDGIGLVNTGNITVGSGLPKPSLGKSRAILQVEVSKTAPTKPVYIQVVNDTLSIYSVDSNGYFWGDISYPVAKS